MILSRCLACDSENLKLTLDLNEQPLANSYKLIRDQIQEEYPLAINRCLDCYHVQLSYAVDPKLMFDDYLYVSGTTQTGRDHFKKFAEYVTDKSNLYTMNSNPKAVLDIGCNDGTQLDYFKELNHETYGIDPAKNLHPISSKNHNVWCSYFDSTFSEMCQTFDIIVAQNVFAHTADPLSFLLNAKKIMNHDSLLFIQTSQAFMIRNHEFDTIYHEHISFFNIQSMKELCRRAGLHLTSVNYMPIHGTSYIFIITKTGETRGAFDEGLVSILIAAEKINFMYDEETYIRYEKHCHEIVTELKKETDSFRNDGFRIIGYGAAAKGMTLLNFSKINLDFIIDDNPLKQNRFTPGASIPIVSSDKLDEVTGPVLFVPLAWNFFDEIRTKIKTKLRDNPDDRFITYFPRVEIKK